MDVVVRTMDTQGLEEAAWLQGAARVRCEELGLSQEALGYRAKVHRTYVRDVERGARNPTVRVIWKLANALDTSPSALFETAERVLALAGRC